MTGRDDDEGGGGGVVGILMIVEQLFALTGARIDRVTGNRMGRKVQPNADCVLLRDCIVIHDSVSMFWSSNNVCAISRVNLNNIFPHT